MDNGSDTRFPPATRIARSPDAISADVAGEVVLLNMATGYFHQLNAVASYLWKQLAQPHTLDELFARAVADFDADEATCRKDIDAFVEELQGHGLIRIER
jgi:hypothetical protein